MNALDELLTGQQDDSFDASLDRLTPDDIAPAPDRRKQTAQRRRARLLRALLLTVVLGVFFFSLYNFIAKLVSYRQSEDIYDRLEQQFYDAAADHSLLGKLPQGTKAPALTPLGTSREDASSIVIDTDGDDDFLKTMQIQLNLLKNINEDICGWIRVDGETAINYPLIFPKDNNYYLYHAADGTSNPAGSIFIDCGNDRELKENRNLVIYGHNMEDGAPMFANLLNFQRYPYYFVDNNKVEIYTDDGVLKYTIFACYEEEPYVTEGSAYDVTFETDAEFQQFLDNIKEKNTLRSDVTLELKDHILTFSTCSNNGVDRLIVQAVMERPEEDA